MKLKFDSKLINSVMDEEKGAALRLLFQIRINRENNVNGLTMTGLKPQILQKKANKNFMVESTLMQKGLTMKVSGTMNKSKKLKNIENRLLKFEETKQRQEYEAFMNQKREEEFVKKLLQDRRQGQIETLH